MVPAAPNRPLAVLPAGLDPALVRADLLESARQRFGDAAVEQALGSPAYLIVKRFAGMAPPPPPGAGRDWEPPTPAAILIRSGDDWLVATATGWRPMNLGPGVEIHQILGNTKFWDEPEYIQACPDFGSSNALLKVSGRKETVRIAQCTSLAASLVDAALRA